MTFVLAAVQMARGAAALGAGRHLDAVEHLRCLFAAGDPAYHPTMRWWALGDLVEAAVRSHQRGLVEPMVAELEPAAEQTPAFWLHTVLRHARALLADDRDAEALFRGGAKLGRAGPAGAPCLGRDEPGAPGGDPRPAHCAGTADRPDSRRGHDQPGDRIAAVPVSNWLSSSLSQVTDAPARWLRPWCVHRFC